MPRSLPTYYLTHGGGPWPWMDAEMGTLYAPLRRSLVELPRQVGDGVRAILVVTAHWESKRFSVSSAAHPGMLYDYYGFPAHTYAVQYPAPGSPELAARVKALLDAGGHPTQLDPERGFDHGTFCMLAPMYPDATIPVVQLSLRADFDPAAHLEVGQLLAPLRDDGVLILGSGSSYHNLRRFNAGAAEPSRQFDDWLQESLLELNADQRALRLRNWEAAPAARIAHAREEHLLPLMVAVGAARDALGRCVYRQTDLLGGITMSSFGFGIE